VTAPDDSLQPLFAESAEFAQPWRLSAPAVQTAAVVFASPHSGREYPADFVAASRLGLLDLRRSEDAYVDEVFAAAPAYGAPLLSARFPRAYVDVNREAFELDPDMFEDPLPDYANTSSPRVTAGLGTIARVVGDGEAIYAGRLRFEDAKRRIEDLYEPYHAALADLIGRTQARFGGCLVIDCHSMPSGAGPTRDNGRPVDVVLGDRFGTACAPAITERAQSALAAAGLEVIRNKPYAGGFTTRHYGRPRDGVHVLQVEINRALYMDEKRVRRGDAMPTLTRRLDGLMAALTGTEPAVLAAA